MICKTFKLTWIWTCKIPVMHDFLLQTLTLAERKQSESVVLVQCRQRPLLCWAGGWRGKGSSCSNLHVLHLALALEAHVLLGAELVIIDWHSVLL